MTAEQTKVTERSKRKAAEAAVRANPMQATDVPLEEKSEQELHGILAMISQHRAEGEVLEQAIRKILTGRRASRS